MCFQHLTYNFTEIQETMVTFIMSYVGFFMKFLTKKFFSINEHAILLILAI